MKPDRATVRQHIEDAAERARLELRRRQERLSKKIPPCERDEIAPVLHGLEHAYAQAMHLRYPSFVIVKWGKRERAAVYEMCKKAPIDLVREGLIYMVRDWEKVYMELFGRYDPQRHFPSVSFFERFGDHILLSMQANPLPT